MRAEEHPRDLVNVVAKQFHIGPQTARVHVQRLCSQNLLTEQGKTRDRVHSLRTLEDWQRTYPLALGMSEHDALGADVWPRLGDLPDNVRSIWSIAFTEMLNNVLDHASATEATIEIRKTAVNTEMVIHDNGVGIFKKIQQALKLTDERYAVVELSKGKFTTDPSKHRVKASSLRRKCLIVSTFWGGLAFPGKPNTQPQWVTEQFHGGTTVRMKLDNDSTRQPKDLYDQFTEDLVFNKTAVPIKLAQVGPGGLVSRSQAKRVLAGIDRFKVAALNFLIDHRPDPRQITDGWLARR